MASILDEPKVGSMTNNKPNIGKLLLLCVVENNSISTVLENIKYLQDMSKFDIEYLNLREHRFNPDCTSYGTELNINIDLAKYEGVIIHNSLSYSVVNLINLDRHLDIKLKDYDGVKILMRQDDNHQFKEMAKYIGETRFDLLLTCLSEESFEKIYPKRIVGKLKIRQMLTGYVTPKLRGINFSEQKRFIDIGYRGSIQELSFGRLAYEKKSIGDDVKKILKDTSLNLDISSTNADKKKGNDWINFLLNSKATLGAESGASIFDINGDLAQRCKEFESINGPYLDVDGNIINSDKKYAEAYLNSIRDLEGLINYNQLSPRHFEAIAAGTIQLLFPGTYSNILIPGKHFFELKRDFSNIEEAIKFISNKEKRIRMAKQAHKAIILNKQYWIETFVSDLDEEILTLMKKKSKNKQALKISENNHNVLLLMAHKLNLDPRIQWIQDYQNKNIKINLLGIHTDHETEGKIDYSIKNSSLNLSVMRQSWNSLGNKGHSLGLQNTPIGIDLLKLYKLVGSDQRGIQAVVELSKIENILLLPEIEFCEILGAPLNHKRNYDFKWYLQYILDTAITLIQTSTHLRGIQSVIATDFDTLAASIIIGSIHKVPVLYDAHEYYVESDVFSLTYEKQFWAEAEKILINLTDYQQTVTPGIASYMENDYKVPVKVVPNCEPIKKHKLKEKLSKGKECNFIFQGGFAPGRGVDLLIDIWAKVNPKAILKLRGPEGIYKDEFKALAKNTGLLGTKIFFPKPVSEDDLVTAPSIDDVGIIPYTPVGKNYQNCCPNKMSQYMAAKLPILANRTNFVEHIINKSKSGVVIDFTDSKLLIETINELTVNKKLRNKFSKNAYAFYSNEFNWQHVAKGMNQRIESFLNEKKYETLYFDKTELNDSICTYVESSSKFDRRAKISVAINDLKIIKNIEESMKTKAPSKIEEHLSMDSMVNKWKILKFFKYIKDKSRNLETIEQAKFRISEEAKYHVGAFSKKIQSKSYYAKTVINKYFLNIPKEFFRVKSYYAKTVINKYFLNIPKEFFIVKSYYAKTVINKYFPIVKNFFK